jgi:hypothetical protein
VHGLVEYGLTLKDLNIGLEATRIIRYTIKKSLSTFSHLAVRIGIKHLSAVAQLTAYNVEFTQVNHNGKQSLVQLPIAMEAITHYGKYLAYVCL